MPVVCTCHVCREATATAVVTDHGLKTYPVCGECLEVLEATRRGANYLAPNGVRVPRLLKLEVAPLVA